MQHEAEGQQEMDTEHRAKAPNMPCTKIEVGAPGYPILRYFDCSSHLPPMLYEVAAQAETLALAMARDLPHCAETTAGLRKLLEAKDCFVRAKIGERK